MTWCNQRLEKKDEAPSITFQRRSSVPTHGQTINFNSNQNQFPFMNGQTITNSARSSCVSSINLFRSRLRDWQLGQLGSIWIQFIVYMILWSEQASLSRGSSAIHVELRSEAVPRHHQTIPILVSRQDLFLWSTVIWLQMQEQLEWNSTAVDKNLVRSFSELVSHWNGFMINSMAA